MLLSVFVPTISAILTNIATRLNNFENYENADSYDYAMIQKIFVLNVLTSYVPLFLTAFVYVPFASYIVPHLDVFNLASPVIMDESQEVQSAPAFQINPSRLRKQVIYFTVTAQVVGLALELVVPAVKRKLFKKAKQLQGKKKDVDSVVRDKDEERSFLEHVRDEAELDVYDVNGDLREMTTQVSHDLLIEGIFNQVLVRILGSIFADLATHRGFLHCKQLDRATE